MFAYTVYKLTLDQNSKLEIPCSCFNVFPVRALKDSDADTVQVA
jgi:hypothetical protein